MCRKDESCLHESQRKPMSLWSVVCMYIINHKTAATDQNFQLGIQHFRTILLKIKYGCLTKICQTASAFYSVFSLTGCFSAERSVHSEPVHIKPAQILLFLSCFHFANNKPASHQHPEMSRSFDSQRAVKSPKPAKCKTKSVHSKQAN